MTMLATTNYESAARLDALPTLITQRVGVTDSRILEVFRRVPRAAFVPPALLAYAEDDVALPLGLGQTISQPSMLALMLAELGCSAEHEVLEVGSGSGYAAALVAQTARHVDGVERLPQLAAGSRRTLARLGIHNVTIHDGNGTTLFPQPSYDRILVSAAAANIPPALLTLLPPGGRLVMPVGGGDPQTLITCDRALSGELHYRASTQCIFVPLIHS